MFLITSGFELARWKMEEFTVWKTYKVLLLTRHQMSRGMSGDHVKGAREGDLLLGVGRVPLIMLLMRKTG